MTCEFQPAVGMWINPERSQFWSDHHLVIGLGNRTMLLRDEQGNECMSGLTQMKNPSHQGDEWFVWRKAQRYVPTWLLVGADGRRKVLDHAPHEAAGDLLVRTDTVRESSTFALQKPILMLTVEPSGRTVISSLVA